MEEFYMILILLLLLVFYGVLSYQINKEYDVLPAITEDEGIRCYHKGYKKKASVIKTMNGGYVSTRRLIRVITNGDGMTHRDILDGEEWLAEPIREDKPIDGQIKVGNVILLYNDGSGKYMVRELSTINTDGTVGTSYRSGEMTVNENVYTLSQIKGILSYCI